MIITKVSRTATGCEVIWNDGKADWSRSENDGVLPDDLVATMQALLWHVEQMLQLDTGYLDGAEVRGVSFRYHQSDGRTGCTITVVKPIAAANSPFVIHTPFQWAHEQGSILETGLAEGCITVLHQVQCEAENFVNSERRQLGLFTAANGNGSAKVSKEVVN